MTPEAVLKQYFGYDSFRGSQRALIAHTLAGRDVLGVMPTGAGKSVCYQVPALMRPGVALVISPLVSLMHDQVARLNASGIPAACLTGAQSYETRAAILERAARGGVKLLYAAPERLTTPRFRAFCARVPLSLVAVDEAHCISQWGQDFRPAYLDIAEFLASLPQRPPVCAFTATATRSVRAEIVRLIGLREPFVSVSGFDRPNLHFSVVRTDQKEIALLHAVRARPGKSGIIYCLTRRQVDDVYGLLRAQNIAAARYHAGLDAAERERSQTDFQFDRRPILVATNAFGMGVDKPNVSFVLHYQMPTDLESYYQEAGRAGRDGEPAECILLYDPQDIQLCRYLIENSRSLSDDPDPETNRRRLQHDLARLRQMAGYCQTDDCLRAYLLQYFGESAPAYCGACGSCGTHWTRADATLDAQKIVSCVFRLNQRGRAVGKQFLIELLRGDPTERVRAGGLTDLTTFGVMRGSSDYHIRYVLDCLIADGYLSCESEDRPVVRLTARSGDIIKKRLPFSVKTPKRVSPVRKAQRVPAVEAGLLDALGGVRQKLAQRAGVPAFSIVSDAQLREIAQRRPRTIDALSRIPGISVYKARRYGPAVVDCVRAYLRENTK